MKVALGLFIFSFLITPATGEAYFTTAQSATKITENTTLFTVTYRFGFLNRELYMPIITERGLKADATKFSVGYELITATDKIVSIGSTTALVLTNDKDIQIKNNRYYLPEGKSAEFTFVAFVTTPADETTNASLLVSHLPFIMVDKGQEIPARLNPSEMLYYRTPEVAI